MSDRVSIGSRYSDGYLILLGAGAASSACVAAWFYGTPKGVTPYFGAVAAGLLFAFTLRLAFVVRNRRWITPTGDGFLLEDRRGRAHIADGQVEDLAFRATVRYDSGRPKATVRQGHLIAHAEGFSGRLDFRYEVRLGKPDPLGEHFERVLARLADRTQAGLGHTPLTGRGWEYDRAGLSFGAGGRVLAPDDVAAVDLVDGKICVWARGEAMPCLRVPAESPGALVLARLLDRELRDRPRAEDDTTDGLGRVMFERTQCASMLVISAITALFGALLVAGSFAAGGAKAAATLAVVYAVIVSPILLAAWVTRRNVFRCHARGVYRRTVWGAAELRYEEVGSFSYKATRHYYNGVYTGTLLEMRFRPHPRRPGRAITYKASVNNADEELERLREHISRVIASHMLRRLASGKGVRWTPEVRFRRGGLEVTTPGGLFRRAETWTLPYDRVAGVNVNEGYFFLFEHGRKKPVYQTPVGVENFFPGFHLLRHVLATPRCWEDWAAPSRGGED